MGGKNPTTSPPHLRGGGGKQKTEVPHVLKTIKGIIEENPDMTGREILALAEAKYAARARPAPRPRVTHERLRELLDYDPETGVFTWKANRIRVRPGERAGRVLPDGYIAIGVDGRRYQAHRLAWLYMTGKWPEGMIDHINLDRQDNRWENLRLATNIQNQANTALRSNNTSGFKGVSWHRLEKKWTANIRRAGKKVWLGYYDTPESAHEAYVMAASDHHGEFARVT